MHLHIAETKKNTIFTSSVYECKLNSKIKNLIKSIVY